MTNGRGFGASHTQLTTAARFPRWSWYAKQRVLVSTAGKTWPFVTLSSGMNILRVFLPPYPLFFFLFFSFCI
jgi:hypothetical protein